MKMGDSSIDGLCASPRTFSIQSALLKGFKDISVKLRPAFFPTSHHPLCNVRVFHWDILYMLGCQLLGQIPVVAVADSPVSSSTCDVRRVVVISRPCLPNLDKNRFLFICLDPAQSGFCLSLWVPSQNPQLEAVTKQKKRKKKRDPLRCTLGPGKSTWYRSM